MQIRRKVFKPSYMQRIRQVLTLSSQNFESLEISHAFLPLFVAKLSQFKNVSFWPTL